MRTEIREVTAKRTIYIAEDGTEFETDKECFDYEYEQRVRSLMCYDEVFGRTTPDRCTYVDLPDIESVLAFRWALDCHWMYTDGLGAPGVYIRVDDEEGDCDSWVNMTEAITKIRGGASNDQN